MRFSDFVADLEGTLSRVYRECLDTSPLPPHVPRAHPPRDRTNDLVNRSLEQVGVDPAAFAREVADFLVWSRGG